MSTFTPRPRGPVRPSTGYSNSPSSPSLLERASTNMHRNASLNALTGQAPSTPSSKMYPDEFNVGDVVNVPGDMFGTVKFIGTVRGKQGRFLGVELDGDFAARGKNNGDVEGVNYFRTTVPGAGIFLPVHRAQRRSPSGDMQDDGTPSGSATNRYSRSPGTPSIPKFAQTVGPSARPSSPQFKPKSRPSLPRPESPIRRPPPNLPPTPGRQFSQSVRLGSKPPGTPGVTRTPVPKVPSTVRGGATPGRPFSRAGSRMSSRPESVAENPMRSPSRLSRPNDAFATLRAELADKDRQLADQTTQLLEMEAAFKELQTLLPTSSPESSRRGSRNGEGEANDVPSLKRALKEKNDKIDSLVAEFDAHRVDFRSTIETLELASDETVRVYEARMSELTAEISTLRENNPAQEEVVAIAGQLKMLEDLVAELEDGLEDARRGEAEARGEVEFLRGEVERGRSELRREREKATESNGYVDRDEELEEKDDEIRDLQAALRKLQSQVDGGAEKDEVERLRASVQRLEISNAELEAQLRQAEHAESPATTPEKPTTNGAPVTNGSAKQKDKWCALCEQDGHQAFDCPNEQY